MIRFAPLLIFIMVVTGCSEPENKQTTPQSASTSRNEAPSEGFVYDCQIFRDQVRQLVKMAEMGYKTEQLRSQFSTCRLALSRIHPTGDTEEKLERQATVLYEQTDEYLVCRMKTELARSERKNDTPPSLYAYDLQQCQAEERMAWGLLETVLGLFSEKIPSR